MNLHKVSQKMINHAYNQELDSTTFEARERIHTELQAVYNEARNQGRNEGYNQGYNEGYDHGRLHGIVKVTKLDCGVEQSGSSQGS